MLKQSELSGCKTVLLAKHQQNWRKRRQTWVHGCGVSTLSFSLLLILHCLWEILQMLVFLCLYVLCREVFSTTERSSPLTSCKLLRKYWPRSEFVVRIINAHIRLWLAIQHVSKQSQLKMLSLRLFSLPLEIAQGAFAGHFAGSAVKQYKSVR